MHEDNSSEDLVKVKRTKRVVINFPSNRNLGWWCCGNCFGIPFSFVHIQEILRNNCRRNGGKQVLHLLFA